MKPQKVALSLPLLALFYLRFHGFDQRNRCAAKRVLSALSQLSQKAFVGCNKLTFFLDSKGKVQAIISRMVDLDRVSCRGFE